MKRIKLISALAIIALFVSFLSSCNSPSDMLLDAKDEAEAKKQFDDSTAKAEADSVQARAERPYTFIPAIVMATKENEKKETCGEGQYKCRTYQAEIYFYKDSADESTKISLYLSAVAPADTKDQYYADQMETMSMLKKAYAKIINTDAKNLIITYYPKSKSIIVKKNLPVQQRKTIGKALLVEEVDDVIYRN